MMFAETKKEVLIEYPINVVYETLLSIFPVKYYDLKGHYPTTHSFRVIDSFNNMFIMHISLKEDTPNTTIIEFLADYPHAIMDLTEGGKQAIETILEELLIQLDKQPKTGSAEAINTDIEVVNKESFVNTTKNKTHTLSITAGYILCILSFVLPIFSLINYDPNDSMMAMLFIAGIVCLAIEISLSIILQYYENSKAILHGRIQLCICGFMLVILGILIHPGLALAGILIPIIPIIYFLERAKSIE